MKFIAISSPKLAGEQRLRILTEFITYPSADFMGLILVKFICNSSRYFT